MSIPCPTAAAAMLSTRPCAGNALLIFGQIVPWAQHPPSRSRYQLLQLVSIPKERLRSSCLNAILVGKNRYRRVRLRHRLKLKRKGADSACDERFTQF